MSAGKEYGSELMRSGDMYVTVPRNVWHCAALHRRWSLRQSGARPAPRVAGSDAICSGSTAAFGELNTTSQEATALLIAGFYGVLYSPGPQYRGGTRSFGRGTSFLGDGKLRMNGVHRF